MATIGLQAYPRSYGMGPSSREGPTILPVQGGGRVYCTAGFCGGSCAELVGSADGASDAPCPKNAHDTMPWPTGALACI